MMPDFISGIWLRPTTSNPIVQWLWVFGWGIRLILIAFLTPQIYSELFIPFIQHWSGGAWFDPWTTFIFEGGDKSAFPYGGLYLIAFGIPTFLGGVFFNDTGAAVGLAFAVLLYDFLLARVIYRIVEKHKSLIAVCYWINPVTLYVCYWHGQLDVFPVLLVVTAILALKNGRYSWSGLLLGLACVAKFSMAIAAPFFLIVFFREKRFRSKAIPFMAGLMLPAAISSPLIFSSGFREMVLGTTETAKLFSIGLPVSDVGNIYIYPLVLASMLLIAWRIGRFSWRSLTGVVGIAFLAIYVTTPASPGWSMWWLPFLVLSLGVHRFFTQATAALLSILVVLQHVFVASGPTLKVWDISSTTRDFDFTRWLDPFIYSATITAVVACGIVLIVQFARINVLNDVYTRATYRPLSVGISGDSGVGKDTLADGLLGLFGATRTVHLSGDDYHMWDRHNPMWRALTHLNPKANYLNLFFRDIHSLLDGRKITKRHYDHSIGRMTRPDVLLPSQFLVVSGLHALLDKEVNSRFDTRVFLDMDEELRRALKTRRDVILRGHPLQNVANSINRREKDGHRYIQPQRANADIIFSLRAKRGDDLRLALKGEGDPNSPIEMVLAIGLLKDANLTDLESLLIGIGCTRIQQLDQNDGEHSWIQVETDISAEAIEVVAYKNMPHLEDLLALKPQWVEGLTGIMQLFILDNLYHRRHLDQQIG